MGDTKKKRGLLALTATLSEGAATNLYTFDVVEGKKGFLEKLNWLDTLYQRQTKYFKSTHDDIRIPSLKEAAQCAALALDYLKEAHAFVTGGLKTAAPHIQNAKELEKMSAELERMQSHWNLCKDHVDLLLKHEPTLQAPAAPATTSRPAPKTRVEDIITPDPVQPDEKPKPDLQAIINQYNRTTNAWTGKWLYNALVRKTSNAEYDKRQKRKATLEILEKLEPLNAEQIIICLQVLHNYYAREGAYNSYMLRAIDHELALHDDQFQLELIGKPYGNFEQELSNAQKQKVPALFAALGDNGIKKDEPRFAFFVEALEAEVNPTMKFQQQSKRK